MSEFFDKYLNINNIMKEKKEYKEAMKRVDALPSDYKYVFEQIQKHMWQFVSGDGYDMLEVQYGLLELFEESSAQGIPVLEVTGEDVASFCDELLKSTKTYNSNLNSKLNKNIQNKLNK